MAEAAASEKEENSSDSEKSEKGKEFYTIQTASEKVFYLVINRDGDDEVVYFLTEVTENDLLNVTTDNSETLPKNSAALESAIPVTEGALPNNNGEQEKEEAMEEGSGEAVEEPEPIKENPAATYIILGIAAIAAIGGGYYFKVVKGKKEEFLDEDDDEEDEEEEYDDDEEEDEDTEDDFFDSKDGEDV